MALLWELLIPVSIIYLLIRRSSDFYFLLVGFSLVVLFLHVLPGCYLPTFSSISFSSVFFSSDSLAFWLSYLVLFLAVVSFLVVPKFSSILSYIMVLLTLACLVVFSSSELLSLYISYEFSLLPILYMIVNNGTYPERSLSASMMFVYTALFSFPFMAYVIYSLVDLGSVSFSLTVPGHWGFSPYVVALAFMSFMVNLPVYGLHFWLPIAHVEAPTYGSIVLAGLLLNIGGCGLYRISFFTSFSGFMSWTISYLILSIVLSSIVCCVQSDFKRLVAYSSVAHIMVVIISVTLCSSLGVSSFLLIMVTHGIASPLLFILVGITYRLHGTRILALYRGLLTTFPLLSIFIILCFVLSVPVPPSLAFLGELQFATAFINVYTHSAFFIFLFVFLGVLYNLLWLGSLFGPHSFSSFSSLNFVLSLRESATLTFMCLQSMLVLFLMV